MWRCGVRLPLRAGGRCGSGVLNGGGLAWAPRGMNTKGEGAVYGGPRVRHADDGNEKGGDGTHLPFTLARLREKYEAGWPVTMVTAYDYPSAVHGDLAGADMLLVGDSAGMVVHGHDTTLAITVEEMLVHCRAVSRGAPRPMVVGDLPFGSYEASAEQAVATGVRFLKEGGVDAVKLEGGGPDRVRAARALAAAGIAVVGHVGLTPQAVSQLGGFRPQGRNAKTAAAVLEGALALEEEGRCVAVVLECVPARVARVITGALGIPTIGIGAGGNCSGQVLVYHDLLGMFSHPHHAKVAPKFCKRYADIGGAIHTALSAFVGDVWSKEFPGKTYSPYRIADDEFNGFARDAERLLRGRPGCDAHALLDDAADT